MTPSYTTVSFPDIFVEPITFDIFQKELETFCDKHNTDRAKQHPNTFIPFKLTLPYKILFGKRVYQLLTDNIITVEIIVSEGARPNWLYMSGVSRDWQQFLRYWLDHLTGYLAAQHTATLDRPEISFDPTPSNEISQCGRNLLVLSTRILGNSILAMRSNKPLYDQGLMAGHDWGFTKTVSPITSLPLPQPKPVKPADEVALEANAVKTPKKRRGGPIPTPEDDIQCIIDKWLKTKGTMPQEVFCKNNSIGVSTLSKWMRERGISS